MISLSIYTNVQDGGDGHESTGRTNKNIMDHPIRSMQDLFDEHTLCIRGVQYLTACGLRMIDLIKFGLLVVDSDNIDVGDGVVSCVNKSSNARDVCFSSFTSFNTLSASILPVEWPKTQWRKLSRAYEALDTPAR